MLPKSGKGKEAMVRTTNEMRNLLAQHIALPFIESIGGNEATTAPGGIPL